MLVILALVVLSAGMGWLMAYMYLDAKYHTRLFDLTQENDELREGLEAAPPQVHEVYVMGIVNPADSDGLREPEIVRTFASLEAAQAFAATLPDPVKHSWFLMKQQLY